IENRFVWASAAALALSLSPIEMNATTNGVILITTRTAQDARYRIISSSTLYDGDDFRGPGAFSPGDAAMGGLLQDNGYVTRLIPEWLLRPEGFDPITADHLDPDFYYIGGGGPPIPGAA